jgi:hypothetical protein
MKKILILIILLCCQVMLLFSQTEYINLQKYWFYRQRLRNNFVVVSSSDEPGTNIPIDLIYTKDTLGITPFLSIDDGNEMLDEYISMLITEYRLLKNNSQDATQTAHELYYALKAVNRLDRTAESYYRSCTDHDVHVGDTNGFFIRNDFDWTFWYKYKKTGTSTGFHFPVDGLNFDPTCTANTNPYHGNPEDESLDCCWNRLMALALVIKYGDETETIDGEQVNFKQYAKVILTRMINYIYHPSNDVPMVLTNILDIQSDIAEIGIAYFNILTQPFGNIYYIKNPVTGFWTQQGSGNDGTGLLVPYGFSTVANTLLNTNNYNSSFLNEILFKQLLSLDVNFNQPTEIDLYLYLFACLPASIYLKHILKINSDPPSQEELLNLRPKFCFINYNHLFHPIKVSNNDDFAILCSALGNIPDFYGFSAYEVL